MEFSDQVNPEATPRFLSGRARELIVPLEEPIVFAGEEVHSITCRRMTGREVEAWYETPESERSPLPTAIASRDLLDALDADDFMRVQGVALGFFPRAWRTADTSTPETSETSSPS